MNSVELGRRIKEARLQKKMTQTELVGDFITRNMLSRIESGNACPSVKTLEYLAQRLEIPAGMLIETDEKEERAVDLSELLFEVKSLFIDGEYSKASKLCDRLMESEFFDEGTAIKAKSSLLLAQKSFDNGEYAKSAELANTALTLAGKGVYSSREIRTSAVLLLDSIADKKLNN